MIFETASLSPTEVYRLLVGGITLDRLHGSALYLKMVSPISPLIHFLVWRVVTRRSYGIHK
jgi:hypothetical protein